MQHVHGVGMCVQGVACAWRAWCGVWGGADVHDVHGMLWCACACVADVGVCGVSVCVWLC